MPIAAGESYCYCLPLIRLHHLQDGGEHRGYQEEAEREERRSLRYGLTEGERRYDVTVTSARLGCGAWWTWSSTPARSVSPWTINPPFASSRGAFSLQLAAYGLMLEEGLATGSKISVRRGFLYSLLTRSAQEVALTGRLRAQVVRTVDALREMVQREQMPPAPQGRGRCVACEFRRFCNDC